MNKEISKKTRVNKSEALKSSEALVDAALLCSSLLSENPKLTDCVVSRSSLVQAVQKDPNVVAWLFTYKGQTLQ